jgi:hypothetical protein
VFTPLRYQASEADCFPTSVLNALAWLFEEDELPGAVVQRVYACTLDGIEHGVAGCCTSRPASIALAEWLGAFKSRTFAVATESLEGREVHLRPAGRIVRWLRRGGVAVLDVRDTPAATHSLLALSASGDHVDFWDPYLRRARYDYGRGAVRLETDGRSPNLSISRSRLESRRNRPYSLGPETERAAVLIRRTKYRRRARAAAPAARSDKAAGRRASRHGQQQ